MATAAAVRDVKDFVFEWEGKDKNGKVVRGEVRSGGEAQVSATLRRQGVLVTKVKKRRMRGGSSIKQKDIAVFTRQLATMMKAGVPLLQAFDIVGRGATNPRLTKLLNDIRTDVETGTSLSVAFRKHPMQFNALYCNLVEAGEQGGILEQLLERLAIYEEKTMQLKQKIKSALVYPVAVMVVAFIVLTIIMIFVIPTFKEVFTSFGAELPAPTLAVMWLSEQFVKYWWLLFGVMIGGGYFFLQTWRRSAMMQMAMDRLFLRIPVFGELIRKAVLARWTRTLSTMFGAGVPLVEAMKSVAGATGNIIYQDAVLRMRDEIATGMRMQRAMENTGLFPNMVVQMIAVGEESGSLDEMASKVADFYEADVDAAVDALSSLLEPMIMVILGVLVGGMVVAMYLPIFKLGAVI